jgi:hypothetical protein
MWCWVVRLGSSDILEEYRFLQNVRIHEASDTVSYLRILGPLAWNININMQRKVWILLRYFKIGIRVSQGCSKFATYLYHLPYFHIRCQGGHHTDLQQVSSGTLWVAITLICSRYRQVLSEWPSHWYAAGIVRYSLSGHHTDLQQVSSGTLWYWHLNLNLLWYWTFAVFWLILLLMWTANLGRLSDSLASCCVLTHSSWRFLGSL